MCCSRALPTALLIVLHDCTANNVHAPISRMEIHMHILHIDALPHWHPPKNVTLKPPCSVSPRLPDQCSSVAWTEHTDKPGQWSAQHPAGCAMSPTVDDWLTPPPSIAMTTASPALLPHPHPETCPHISSSWVLHLELWSFSLQEKGREGERDRCVSVYNLHFLRNRPRVDVMLTPPNSAISHN